MKTGKIKYYTPIGKGKPFKNSEGQEVILDDYKVGFADGNEYKFGVKGEWRHEVGTEISYIVSSEQYKYAKGAKTLNTEPNTKNVINNRPISTNDSILLQVCYKENMQAFGKENRSVVINNTKEDFLSLKGILNNI